MTHNLTLVLTDLLEFLALEFKAKHRPLSATATPLVSQGLGGNDKREGAELQAKVVSIINEQTDLGRIF